MSTIEDKILDGPRVHYCEANDDDIRNCEDSNGASIESRDLSSLFVRPSDEGDRSNQPSHVNPRGGSSNTGPKGVIEDYKKQSDPREKNDFDDLEAEFQELMNDDSILKDYISKRIASATSFNLPTFGHVLPMKTGTDLLAAIDKENPNVAVIVHIYKKYSKSCANLNQCLPQLADLYKHVKFVTLDASVTSLSENFKENGVPALLGYKGGDLFKSLVQLEELLDRDFDVKQLEELLVDNGILH